MPLPLEPPVDRFTAGSSKTLVLHDLEALGHRCPLWRVPRGAKKVVNGGPL